MELIILLLLVHFSYQMKIKIHCYENCDQREKGLSNPNYPIVLFATCTGSDCGQVKFEWSLSSTSGNAKMELSDEDATGFKEQKFTIKAKALVGGESYRIMLQAYLSSDPAKKVSITLMITMGVCTTRRPCVKEHDSSVDYTGDAQFEEEISTLSEDELKEKREEHLGTLNAIDKKNKLYNQYRKEYLMILKKHKGFNALFLAEKYIQGENIPFSTGAVKTITDILQEASKHMRSLAENKEFNKQQVIEKSKSMIQTIMKYVDTSEAQLTIDIQGSIEQTDTDPPYHHDLLNEDYPIYDYFDVNVHGKHKNFELITDNVLMTIENIGDSLLFTMPDKTDESTIKLDDICLLCSKITKNDLTEKQIKICDKYIDISAALAKELAEKTDIVSISFAVFNKNYFWWKTTNMSTNHVLLKLMNGHTVITELKNPVNTFSKINYDNSKFVSQALCMPPNITMAELPDEQIPVFQLLPERPLKYLHLQFNNMKSGDTIRVVILDNIRPIGLDFDNAFLIEEGKDTDLSYRININTGDFEYVGIMPTEETFSKSKNMYGDEECYNMSVRISRVSCDIWNREEFEWNPEYCNVNDNSTTTDIICSCTHASVFMTSSNNLPSAVVADWTIPIDIESEVNFVVLIAHAIVMIIFLFFFYCAYQSQLSLNIKKEVIYLFDNNMRREYRYLLCIYTGAMRYSGTTATVGIKLFGSKAESERHILRGFYEPVLQRGNEDWFYLLSYNLGELLDIELWTDCHGISKSWYCRRVLVYSIEDHRMWKFEVHEWLSVLNNNTSNRYSVNTEQPKKSTIKFVYIGLSRHLWASPFKRIGNEQFTWYDRLILMQFIVFFCMLLCIFVFGVPSPEIYGQFGRGHFEFGSYEMGLALLVAVVVFGTSIMLLFLFTTSASWPLLYLVKVNGTYKYFARLLLYGASVAIFISLIYFGIWFSFKSSLVWIPMFIAAVFFCIVLEIIRVVLIAIIVRQMKPTYISRLDLASVHYQQEKVFRQFKEKGMRPFFQKYYMPISQVSKHLKRERELTRLDLRNILADVTMYVIYMIILFCIVLLNKDPMGIRLSTNIEEIFIEDTYIRLNKFKNINSVNDLAAYLRNVFFPAIYSTRWYGKMTSSEAGLLVDFNSKLLGIPRVRQHRVQQKSCGLFHYTFAEQDVPELNLPCHAEFSRALMDTGKYSARWNSPRLVPKGSFEARTSNIWEYKTGSESQSGKIYGELTFYPGGGYVANFGRNIQNSLLVLNYLLNTDWIDQRTRALFFEVYVYNANQNLFGLLTLIIEISAAGNFVQTRKLRVSKFLFLHDEIAIATFICFLMLIAMILSFSFRKYQQLKTNIVHFFKQVWNVIDIVIIFNAFGFVVVYLLRDKVVSELVKELEEAAHNKFVSFNNALFWDDGVTISATLLVAVSTVRLWKLLRFMKMFRVCELTLVLSAKYLFGITFIGITLLLAYSIFAFVIFGPYSSNFTSMSESFLTLIIYCSGFEVDLDYKIFDEILFGVGYIFYIFYLLILIFILNIFITIVVVGYESSKHYYDESEQEKLFAYNLGDFLMDEWRITFSKDKGRTFSTKLAAGGEDDILEIEELYIDLRKDVHRKEARINRDRMLKMHLIVQGIMYIEYERKLFKRRPAVEEYQDFVAALTEQLIDDEYETFRNKEDDDVYIVIQEEEIYKYLAKDRITDMFNIVEYLLTKTYKKEKKDTISSDLVDQTGAAVSVLNSKVKDMIKRIEKLSKYAVVNKGTNVTFEDLGLLEINEDIEKKLKKVENKVKGIIEEDEDLKTSIEEKEDAEEELLLIEDFDNSDIQVTYENEKLPEVSEEHKQELEKKASEKDTSEIKLTDEVVSESFEEHKRRNLETSKSVRWKTNENLDNKKSLNANLLDSDRKEKLNNRKSTRDMGTSAHIRRSFKKDISPVKSNLSDATTNSSKKSETSIADYHRISEKRNDKHKSEVQIPGTTKKHLLEENPSVTESLHKQKSDKPIGGIISSHSKKHISVKFDAEKNKIFEINETNKERTKSKVLHKNSSKKLTFPENKRKSQRFLEKKANISSEKMSKHNITPENKTSEHSVTSENIMPEHETDEDETNKTDKTKPKKDK